MQDIVSQIKTIRARILKKDGTPRQYMLISSFKDTSMEDKTLASPYFRVFQPIKPEKDRKSNIFSKTLFDYHKDSLMDYPSIIQYKLGGKWEWYNRLISVHVPSCTFNCWHCYNDKKLHSENSANFVSAHEIVEKFCEQRNKDRQQDIFTNVLRVTGGEPFLLPELILECLQIIYNDEQLKGKVFIWTETNLSPFVSAGGKESIVKELNILPELSKFDNLAVHPCIHGLNSQNIQEVTNRYDLSIDDLLNGIKILLDSKIDIYPTIGSNVVPPSELGHLFEELYKLNPFLPLRFALVEYDLAYEPIKARAKQETVRNQRLYSKFSNLRIWNDLLEKHYNIGYAVIPRHLVPLYGSDKERTLIKAQSLSIDTSFKQPVVHIFKSSFRDEYHREILDMLALPEDYVYKLEYDKPYLQDDLFHHVQLNPGHYEGMNAVLIYVDTSREQTKTFCPLRRIKIVKFDTAGDTFVLHFQLKALVPITNSNDLERVQKKLTEFYGMSVLPPGGKYILLAEDVGINDDRYGERDELKIWQGIVNALVKYKRFRTSLFYKLTPVGLELNRNVNHICRSEFKVKGGEGFSLRIDYYLPNYDNFDRGKPGQRTIKVEASDRNVQIIGPGELCMSKYGSHDIYLKTTKVLDDLKASITLWSDEKPFDAAMLDIPIMISGDKSKVILKTVGNKVSMGLATFGLTIFTVLFKESIVPGTASFSWSRSGLLLLVLVFFFYALSGILDVKGRKS